MEIEVFNSFSPEVEKKWKEFEKTAFGTPFQSYAWLYNWQNTIGSPLHSILPKIIFLRNEQETLGVFPLGLIEKWRISTLVWLGGSHTDYMGPLLSKKWENIVVDFPICWNNIINKLGHFDVIHLQKQKKYIGLLKNPFQSSLYRAENIFAYHVNLRNSWKKHCEETLKNKLRADSRRQRRHLESIGDLCFVVAEEEREKKNIINIMIRQKSRRYRDTGVWDMLSVPQHREFYEKLSKIKDDSLKIHCAELRVGETVVATHIGLIDRSTFYYMMPSHEGGNWEKYSPGRMLLEYLMEWSIQKKLKVFDFTLGSERYKKDWSDTETRLFEILEPFTIKGKIYVIAQHIKQKLIEKKWLGERLIMIKAFLKNRKVTFTIFNSKRGNGAK